MQHSVARVPWGASADGRAHITGRLSTIDKCWTKGGVLRNQAEVAGLVPRQRQRRRHVRAMVPRAVSYDFVVRQDIWGRRGRDGSL